ncbi:MAG TPA: NAD(P)H-dependent oxidoreductase [Chitinophagales bacterium]|nr:NAD(P)H-dependent oxidoreductase [Chitinophagales bacterium]
MLQLKIIVASTRPGRKGIVIAKWILETAQKQSEFETELLDLAEINLPFLDEPEHPRFKKYSKQHTFEWSAKIESGDAFIAVTPEYNYGYPAPLKNALDFVYQEWGNKPIAFVSYGGIAGGIRAVQLLKPVVLAMKMIPILEAVNIPMFTQYIHEGRFIANDIIQKSADHMLRELVRWGGSLKELRMKGSI